MKRLFNEFLKTLDRRKKYSVGQVAKLFTQWASSNNVAQKFRTHTTGPTIRKWLQKQDRIKWSE